LVGLRSGVKRVKGKKPSPFPGFRQSPIRCSNCQRTLRWFGAVSRRSILLRLRSGSGFRQRAPPSTALRVTPAKRLKLLQSDLYRRARRVLSQWISSTDDCWGRFRLGHRSVKGKASHPSRKPRRMGQPWCGCVGGRLGQPPVSSNLCRNRCDFSRARRGLSLAILCCCYSLENRYRNWTATACPGPKIGLPS